MKQSITFFHIVILVLVAAGMSRASFMVEADCSHCLQQNVESRCCTTQPALSAGDCCALPQQKQACPHGDICSDVKDTTGFTGAQIALEKPVVHHQAVCEAPVLETRTRIDQRRCAATAAHRPPLFVLNCSYLI